MNVGFNFLRHESGTGHLSLSLSQLNETLSTGALEISSPGWGLTARLPLPLKKLFSTLLIDAFSSLAPFYNSGLAEESRSYAAGSQVLYGRVCVLPYFSLLMSIMVASPSKPGS